MKKLLTLITTVMISFCANAQYEVNFAKYAADNIEFGSTLYPDEMDFEKSFKAGKAQLMSVRTEKEEFTKDFGVKGRDWMIRFKDGKAIGLYCSRPEDMREFGFQNVKAGQTISIAVRAYKDENLKSPEAGENTEAAGSEPYRFEYDALGKHRWVDYTIYKYKVKADGMAVILVPTEEFIGLVKVE